MQCSRYLGGREFIIHVPEVMSEGRLGQRCVVDAYPLSHSHKVRWGVEAGFVAVVSQDRLTHRTRRPLALGATHMNHRQLSVQLFHAHASPWQLKDDDYKLYLNPDIAILHCFRNISSCTSRPYNYVDTKGLLRFSIHCTLFKIFFLLWF